MKSVSPISKFPNSLKQEIIKVSDFDNNPQWKRSLNMQNSLIPHEGIFFRSNDVKIRAK